MQSLLVTCSRHHGRLFLLILLLQSGVLNLNKLWLPESLWTTVNQLLSMQKRPRR